MCAKFQVDDFKTERLDCVNKRVKKMILSIDFGVSLFFLAVIILSAIEKTLSEASTTGRYRKNITLRVTVTKMHG